jgi:hypothetical protein
MDSAPIATLVAQWAPILGKPAAGIIGALLVSVVIAAHGMMPWMPVASAQSAAWYRALYIVLRFAAGNYRNAAPGASQ